MPWWILVLLVRTSRDFIFQGYTPITKISLSLTPENISECTSVWEKGLQTQEAVTQCFRRFQYFDKNDGALCKLSLHLFLCVLKTS